MMEEFNTYLDGKIEVLYFGHKTFFIGGKEFMNSCLVSNKVGESQSNPS